MTNPTYGSLWPRYAKQWDSMSIRPNKVNTFKAIAQKLVSLKSHYVAVEKRTGVPWYMVALLHMRESDNDFRTQLAQGDPLSRVSVHVPRGRGPFNTWEDGAYDALVTLKGWNRVIDWRLEKILYYAELYNGWGYFYHGVPSAYLWAGSTIYSGGKYVADGVWSSSAQDVQPGVAPVLKCMIELDPTINPKRESALPEKTVVAAPIIVGTTAAVAQPHLWPYILGGVVLCLIAYGIYKYLKRNKNVTVVQNSVPVAS
jgi:lysozyme family protein